MCFFSGHQYPENLNQNDVAQPEQQQREQQRHAAENENSWLVEPLLEHEVQDHDREEAGEIETYDEEPAEDP